jgi:uncharacterized membrane protein
MYREMTARGWYAARPDRVRLHWGIISAAVLCISLGAEVAAIIATDLALVPLPLVLAGLVLIAMVRKMPVRTAVGNEVASQARGFRSYLQTTAIQQACSAGQPGLLYDCMPYAIAFGCTGQWDAMSAALPPDAGSAWYHSHLGPSALTTSFIPAIHHFAAAATSSSPASGSGSAGGSGFSGGAAGGGGGGGGGGSW